MRFPPSPSTLLDSATNAYDLVLGSGPADLSGQPSSIIDEGPQRVVHRYRARETTWRHLDEFPAEHDPLHAEAGRTEKAAG